MQNFTLDTSSAVNSATFMHGRPTRLMLTFIQQQSEAKPALPTQTMLELIRHKGCEPASNRQTQAVRPAVLATLLKQPR